MYSSRSDVHKSKKRKNKLKNKRAIASLYIALAIILLILIIGLFIWKTVDLKADPSAVNIPYANEDNSVEVENPKNNNVKPTEEPVDNTDKTVGPENMDTTVDPDNIDTTVDPNAISPEPGNPNGTDNTLVTLDFVGDIMLGSNVGVLLETNGYDYPYSHVRSHLEKADYAIANLETAVTERGVAQDKQYVFRTSPQALPALKDAGFDLLNLANNHSMDYGLEGLFDTIKFLDEVGLNHMGAGKDADEAYTPHIVEINGLKIAFLGFTRVVPDVSWKAGKDQPGLAETYNYTRPVESILQAKEQADLVIVFTHWGIERQDTPDKFQVELAHRYIDAGADLVVGSHAHVLQGFELYKGKWIAYGLGNFIFTSNGNSVTSKTAILEASCSKEQSCSLQIVPFIIKSAKPEPLDDSASQILYKHLSDISINATLDSDGKVVEE